MYSDSESDFTTYTQEERINQLIEAESELKADRDRQIEQRRREVFEEIPSELRNLPGLNITTFKSTKISFTFNANEVADFIPPNTSFKVTLIYKKKHRYWAPSRTQVPLNLYPGVVDLYLKGKLVRDIDVIRSISQVYLKLQEWAKKFRLWEKKRYKKYLKGEIRDEDLTYDDEQLFLNDDERLARLNYRRIIERRVERMHS